MSGTTLAEFREATILPQDRPVMERCSMKRKSTDSGTQSSSDCVRTNTLAMWSSNTETKLNFYFFITGATRFRFPSWWWSRAQTSALQQATPFLGATNRDTTTIPPIAISRNTRTLNGTFTGDMYFTFPSFPQTLEREGYCANLRQRMVPRYRRASTFGTAG
jgi:hypothetical protein